MSTTPGRETAAATTDVLWEPVRVGTLELPNRVVVSAHATRHDIPRYADYLAARARGGAGLLVTGAIAVHPTSFTHPASFRGWDDAILADYERLSAAVAGEGGTLFGQINHAGHQDLGSFDLDHWHAPVAPSAVRSPVVGVHARALEREDILALVEAFGRAAVRVRDGGLAGVEVHGAHGYLLHEFLSPLTNHRTDEYGGDAEGRARFVIDVGLRVRELCGTDFPVGLKLSFEEFVGARGITPEHAIGTLRVIHAAGLFDYISISGAGYHALHQLVPPMESGMSGHLAPHSALAKQVVGSLPVMVTGAVRDIERAAEIVAAGEADLVGMVRAHLADPDLVRKARAGRAAEIRPCVGANQGCWRRFHRLQMVSCTVNPEAGGEETGGRHGSGSKRVLVLGGGPAGLAAAETAARAGNDVVLLEREAQLGGQLRWAARLPGRDRWQLLVDHFGRSLDRLGVEVRCDVAATVETIRNESADAVVLATGGTWSTSGASILRPDRDSIPGLATARVLTPVDVVRDPSACGARVMVYDEYGTYIALGLADLLGEHGCQVQFVTPHSQVGHQTGVLATADLPWIYPRLIRRGVAFTTEHTIEAVEGSDVTLAHVWGASPEVTEVDSIVLCQERRPEASLYQGLRDADVPVHRIGDCLAPREVDDAILEGVRVMSALATVSGKHA